MNALGVSDSGIGYLLSLGLAVQFVASLLGGVLTDKLGRRRTTAMFDVISWVIPSLIWAFAQNIWWFAAAAVLNAMNQVVNNSWSCLLVEDTDPRKLVNVYAWIEIAGLISVFFAPISSLLVGRFDVVPVVRGLYLFTFLTMTAKASLLYIFSEETHQGRIRMAETKNVSVFSMLAGYGGIVKSIFASRGMLIVLAVMTLETMWLMPVNNFFSLYVTQNLGISEVFVPIFPMVKAFVTLLALFLLQKRLDRLPFRPVMLFGLALYAAGHAVLLAAPVNGLWVIFVYTVVDAFAAALVLPRKSSLAVWFVDPEQRARINGVVKAVMIGISVPFGALTGLLAEADRRLPFMLNILLFAVCFAVIACSREVRERIDGGRA